MTEDKCKVLGFSGQECPTQFVQLLIMQADKSRRPFDLGCLKGFKL